MDSAQRLQKILEIYGIKAKNLADKIGLDRPQAIYDIISGKTRGISEKMAVKIISAFPDINKVWLLTGEGDVLNRVIPAEEILSDMRKRIPLFDDATIGGNNEQVANVNEASTPTEWIDAGDWFPTATSAIHHYGDSMVEYPSGCILALKRVMDSRLLINGENYVIETDEFRITKKILVDENEIIAYSTNQETYPDGRQIHSPIRIPKESIRHFDLVLGCVITKFSNPIKIM